MGEFLREVKFSSVLYYWPSKYFRHARLEVVELDDEFIRLFAHTPNLCYLNLMRVVVGRSMQDDNLAFQNYNMCFTMLADMVGSRLKILVMDCYSCNLKVSQ